MHRVAGQEDAAVAIVLGEQQVVMPRHNVRDLEGAGETDQLLDHRPEVGIRRQRCMQGEFRAAALGDQGRAIGVDEIVVPPLPVTIFR